MERFRLDGRVAVVTGAAGSLGRAVVEALRAAGATTVGLDLEPLDDASGSTGVIDVANDMSVHAAFASIVDTFGAPYVLVHAASISSHGSTFDLHVEEWDRVQAINLRGTFLCARAAAKAMLGAGLGGAIVNVASQLAITPISERAAYVASKAGVIGLTKALALEWAPLGIRVNAVAPGPIATPITPTLPTERVQELKQRVPLGRFATPEEIAAACLYLASDAATYVTGEVHVVDGGYSVG